MKSIVLYLLCLIIIATAASCTDMTATQDQTTFAAATTESSDAATADESTTSTTTTETSSSEAATTTEATTTEATTTESTTTDSTTPETTSTEAADTTGTTTETTTEAANSPVNTLIMYSSYAHMVSYDPARGWADFDYFNMLLGDEAVQYLVDNEGYSLEEAQELVDDFADSEFVYQNDNPQLRTIDLREVDLKLMYYPDGTMVTGATPADSELIDLYDLYHVNPDLVLDSFFYYITVINDEVVTVEQVYWP